MHFILRYLSSTRLCPDGLYTYAVDIWSCGCILAEMLGRDPIFPGKNFINQLSLVFDVIGAPKENEVQHIVNEAALKFLSKQKTKKKVPFSQLYPNASPHAWQLLEELLVFDPDKRLTVDQALDSPYLYGAGLSESLVFPLVSDEFEFSFESANFSKNQLKRLILEEVASFKKEKSPILTQPTSMKSNREHLSDRTDQSRGFSKARNPSFGSLHDGPTQNRVQKADLD